MKTGVPFPGGGCYLKNRNEAIAACSALLSCNTSNMRVLWRGAQCWVAFTPLYGKRKLKRTGTIFQRVGNRLVYLPNDGWWPTDVAGVVATVDSWSELGPRVVISSRSATGHAGR